METGELISKYRKDAGMTIDELVVASGVPKGTLNKIAYFGNYESHCVCSGEMSCRF